MDQAERLRTLMEENEAARGRSRVIAVASGKGGVGKTNLCLNLAIAMTQLGKRVVVVDLDIGLANADVLLGVQPKYNLRHVLRGQVKVADALVTAPGGIFLLPGSTGLPLVSDLDEEERSFLVQTFRELEEYADVLIIDTAAGITRNVIHFASSADEIIVATTPEPTAITDGYALVKTVSREKGFGRIRVVVNQTRNRQEGERVSERIRMVSRRFLDLRLEHLGCIPMDDHVRSAVRRRRPFVLAYPKAPASECVRSLAKSLLADGRERQETFSARLETASSMRD